MEIRRWVIELALTLAVIFFVVCGIASVPAQAGTVLMTAPSIVGSEAGEGVGPDGYPESRFGDVLPTSSSAVKDEASRMPASEGVIATDIAPLAADPEIETAAQRRKGVQEVAIIAHDLGFFPKTIFVSRDVPVRLFVTGASKHTLCVMMDSFHVRKQIRTNKIEEITFTPNMPGKYRFYCPVNGMEGTMVVKELTTNFAQQ